jgi:hypothetical protein
LQTREYSDISNAPAESLQETDKDTMIGVILVFLEEAHRSKDWIIHEIKNQDLKITVNSENAYDILSSCPQEFLAFLLHKMKGDDIATPEGVQTRIYHWFFSDIVAGSNPKIPTKAQVRKIIVLNDLISKTVSFKERKPELTIILPTGDGMAIGFGDSPERPVLLSVELHKALAEYNKSKRGREKLLLRIGIESGPVYFVTDLEGNDNVWGPGIIMTRRVMDLAGDMQIYAASRVAEELVLKSTKYKEMLHFVQTYETNYGEKINLYNIYGEGFGTKSVTMPKKEEKIPEKKTTSFGFNEIEIKIDVTDLDTFQAHHSWTWDVTNVSKEPRSSIFYFIEGQVERNFSQLGVKITDQESGKKLKIHEVSVDRPLKKEFHVALDMPVLPGKKRRLKMEYDWQVPDRTFTYRFPSAVKKFNYILTLPNKIDIKSRILKVDVDTGQKIHANPPLSIKKIGKNVEISWTKTNIPSHDAYQFNW